VKERNNDLSVPEKSSDILYLLPPTPDRRASLDAVLRGESRPERYLFYGLDYFRSAGCSVTHNVMSFSAKVYRVGATYRWVIARLGGYGGDLDWLIPVWGRLHRAGLIVAFSDRAVLPLCYLRMLGLLPRRPVIYITMGLPEKLEMFSCDFLRKRVLAELSRLSRVVSLSWPEAEQLKSRYELSNNAMFMTTGVDVGYFHPVEVEPDIDVLSIGGDPFRDFETLLAAARRLSGLRFMVITRRAMAEMFREVPANVEVITDVPMNEIRMHIARSRCLTLPVIENSYSGATTVLLQAMAMGKPIIANKVASNMEGYGFQHEENCIFVPTKNIEALERAICDLCDHLDVCRRLGEAARRHIESKLKLERFHHQLFDLAMEICPDIVPRDIEKEWR